MFDLISLPHRIMCLGWQTGMFSACAGTLVEGTQVAFNTQYCTAFRAAPFKTTQLDSLPRWTANVESGRVGIPSLINRLTTAFNPVQPLYSTTPPDSTRYMNALTCMQEIHNMMETEMFTFPSVVYLNFPINPEDPGGATKSVVAGRNLYRFSAFGMYEFPFSWFVRCTVLVGRSPTDETVNCPEWDNRFPIPPVDPDTKPASGSDSVWNFLTRVDGGMWFPDRNGRIAQHRATWQSMVDRKATARIFAQYFSMDRFKTQHGTSTLLDFQRECASGRYIDILYYIFLFILIHILIHIFIHISIHILILTDLTATFLQERGQKTL